MPKNNLTILLYHGVFPSGYKLNGFNSSGKHISEEEFDLQMQFIKKNCNIVRMTDLISNENIPKNSIAVTFDDGYFNNYSVAFPILKKYEIPATIYLTTGYIGKNYLGWGDLLEILILSTKQKKLQLTSLGNSLWCIDGYDEKINAFNEIKAKCKSMMDAKKNNVIEEIVNILGCVEVESTDHPLFSYMNWDQARDMLNSQIIDFGAHTVDHVSLARLDFKSMKFQISESISQITKQLGFTCKLFAYPEGQEGDFNQDVIDVLRHYGIEQSPSAVHGDNLIPIRDQFHLKRVMPGMGGYNFPYEELS